MSRLLFFLAVAMFVVWLVRQRLGINRKPSAPPPPAPSSASSKHMVACLHCHVHVPMHDAVRGVRGHYCSEAHRQLAEDR
ncbi:hypothetical protein KIK84_11700 [Curvibacter sp. CHRR-16]|uniref:PP0621 family protein n=1 Tax=Curvibacter sp. CHRR-16 TaxID=2835872 RepID=UPI001BD9CBD7|nr:PP0621 family protein [Curvibacter sp. CHRR-16]MBT0570996.1 hypothetical protein [Curvibacter sp. CHRR-16]